MSNSGWFFFLLLLSSEFLLTSFSSFSLFQAGAGEFLLLTGILTILKSFCSLGFGLRHTFCGSFKRNLLKFWRPTEIFWRIHRVQCRQAFSGIKDLVPGLGIVAFAVCWLNSRSFTWFLKNNVRKLRNWIFFSSNFKQGIETS